MSRRPILDAFRSVGTTVTLLGSVATAAVGWGVLTAAEGDAVAGLLGLIPGAVTAATGLLTAFGVLGTAERQTTPVADPRDNDGNQLVPSVR